MFLDADERLLPIIYRISPVNLDTLKSFAKAGIKTIRLNATASWHESEPSPGVYYWDEIDRRVGPALEAGLKVAVHLYRRAPDWIPDEGKIEMTWTMGTWRLGKNPDRVFKGQTYLAINPFHADTLKMELDFLVHACEHFSIPGKVECSYSMPYSAERVLPVYGYGAGSYTEQMCIDVVLERQEVFAAYGEGLWTAWHPELGSMASSINASIFPYVGTEHAPAIYEAMHEQFPYHSLNRILYGFFTIPGSWDRGPLPHVKTWVGAEYATGVVEHAKILNSIDTWGMIMGCPTSFAGFAPRQPTPEEFDAIAEAVVILNDELEGAQENFMRARNP